MQIVRIAPNVPSFKNRRSGSVSDKTYYQQLAARISIFLEPTLLANSLCPWRERRRMHKREVQIGNPVEHISIG